MGSAAGIDWDEVFLNAAFEPDRWTEALDVMAQATGSSHGQLIGVGGPRDASLNLISNFDWSLLDSYLENGGPSPASNYRVAAAQHHIDRGFYDPILHEAHYDAALPHLESDAYVRWCEEAGIPFGCQTNLVVDRVGLVGFALLRSQRDGRTTPAQRRTFALAAQAARRTVRLQERLEGEQAKLLAGSFEAIGVAAFIIDHRGILLCHTAGAEAHLTSGAVSLRQGRLEGPGKPMTLEQAVHALTSDPGHAHVRFCVDRSGIAGPLFMEGFRLPERPWSFGHLPHAILVARSPARDRAGVAPFLCALYGLTAAEADIAVRLYEGKARARIAAEREVTAETLRGQIKSIYNKLGVSHERELLTLLMPVMQ